MHCFDLFIASFEYMGLFYVFQLSFYGGGGCWLYLSITYR